MGANKAKRSPESILHVARHHYRLRRSRNTRHVWRLSAACAAVLCAVVPRSSLLARYTDGFVFSIVGISQNPDVFEQPFHSLNAKVSRKLGEDQRMRINLSATNILNARFRQEYESFGAENQTFAAYSPGTAFSLGLSYKL